MFFYFIYFVFLNYLTFVASSSPGEPLGELCIVAILFRHGDRAPLGTYPKDPYRDESIWPNGWGQLTKLGKIQQHELGRWIRRRYWNFLPCKYSPRDIYVQATDVDRVLMSAYLNLAGLYEHWVKNNNDGLTCQCIPVHTTPVKMDSVLATKKKCPKYKALFDELIQSKEVSAINECYANMFKDLSEHTGSRIKSIKDCAPLFDTLLVQHMNGFALPNWTANYYPQPLQRAVELSFQIPCFTPQLKRLKCGPLLKDIIDHMEEKIKGNVTQKIWMYSAHDSTVTNFLMCLNLYDGTLPPYNAMVLVELYKLNNNYYVIISYKKSTSFKILKLPFCAKVCPFEVFKKMFKPVLPDNWESECAHKRK